MCKSEIFRQTLEIVAAETEIPVERICSGRKDRETVDARYLFVHALYENGAHIPAIAARLSCTRRAVEKMVEQFEERRDRSGRMFGIVSVRIANKLRTRLESADCI